jgi:hypothetical protein
MEFDYKLNVYRCEFCHRYFTGAENSAVHKFPSYMGRTEELVYCGTGIECILESLALSHDDDIRAGRGKKQSDKLILKPA